MAVRSSAAVLLAAGLAGCGLAGCASMPMPLAADGSPNQAEELAKQAYDVESRSGDTALVLYHQAVTVSGEAPSAYLHLAEACMRMHRWKDAIEAYRKALGGAPDNAEVQLGLGTALVRDGQLKDGVAALAKAAPVVATGAAYNRLGVAETMVGNFSQAQAAYEHGLTVAPEDIDIATNLAIAAALGEDAEKARQVAERVAGSPGATAVHRRNLVIVYGMIGRSSSDARAVAPNELSPGEFAKLFERAAAIRKIADPAKRAQAVGTIQG